MENRRSSGYLKRRIHNVSSARSRLSNLSNLTHSFNNSRRSDSRSRASETTKYNADQVVGKGTFGTVYKAVCKKTGTNVAIKKVFQDRRYKNRELQTMKELRHFNIVELKQAFYTRGDKPDDMYLNLVMEYIPETVYSVIKRYLKMRQTIPMLLVKLYSYHMLRGIAYLHSVGVCHRDIKPQNLLVDPSSHVCKVCDFGSAKKLVPGEPSVAYICSRYYRAPELIFGATEYSNIIDVWSIGCVIAEMVLGRPLFPGDSSLNQLIEIIKVLGSPTEAQLYSMNPEYSDNKLPYVKTRPWSKVFRANTPSSFLDFIGSLLQYDPSARPLPLDALAHPFFDELREQKCRLPNGRQPANLFDFNRDEIRSMSAATRERIIPVWYSQQSK